MGTALIIRQGAFKGQAGQQENQVGWQGAGHSPQDDEQDQEGEQHQETAGDDNAPAERYAQHDEPHNQHVGRLAPGYCPAAADRSDDAQAFQGARLPEDSV